MEGLLVMDASDHAAAAGQRKQARPLASAGG
jgi:hypothetical protein